MPDIWLRLGVERHVGLLSYDDANWSGKDDAFEMSYTLFILQSGSPLHPIGGFTQGGASTEMPRI